MIKPVDLETIWRIRHEVMYPELPIDHIKLSDDPRGTHLAVFVNNEPVSVISLFERDGVWQFRKFATLVTHQGKGYGTLLLDHSMTLAKDRSATSIWCNARTTASALYERFGMRPVGDTWTANGHSYIRMEKTFI